jgi:hypothetical protein
MRDLILTLAMWIFGAGLARPASAALWLQRPLVTPEGIQYVTRLGGDSLEETLVALGAPHPMQAPGAREPFEANAAVLAGITIAGVKLEPAEACAIRLDVSKASGVALLPPFQGRLEAGKVLGELLEVMGAVLDGRGRGKATGARCKVELIGLAANPELAAKKWGDALPQHDERPDRALGFVELDGTVQRNLDLALYEKPSRDAPIVSHVRDAAALTTAEYGYEKRGILVAGEDNGWLKIGHEAGTGWLPPERSGAYVKLFDVLKNGLAFMQASWDGSLYEEPAGKLASVDGALPSETSVEVVEERWVGGEWWLKVEVLNANPCQASGDVKTIRSGWNKGHDSDGMSVVGIYARGC